MHVLPREQPDDSWLAARWWARSGVMALCGHRHGPPLVPPLPVPSKLSALTREIERRTDARGARVRVNWEAALAGRAALLGLTRRGAMSPNGTCRFLKTEDGEIALNLARASDLELVPALTGITDPRADPWKVVEAAAAGASSKEFVTSARLLGMAASVPGESAGAEPWRLTTRGTSKAPEPDRPLTVVDLSSLWAGPLAARILGEAGARVTKVEDPSRPDGARQTPEFYSWLHPARERTAEVDFQSAQGRRALLELLESADVVIEASRPRALEHLGLSPEQTGGPDGQVWLSITAYGRTGDARNWTGFGDDTAASAGLLCRDGAGDVMFSGDAMADPLTGIAAALAVFRSLDEGGGQLIDISLSGSAAWFASGDEDAAKPVATPSRDGWVLAHGGKTERVEERPSDLALFSAS